MTLQIKTPSNAQGFSFDFDFYSGEWPEYVCTEFNDSFVAWLQSSAWTGTNGDGDLNISFDSLGNAVSVNNGFFDHCTPNSTTGCDGNNTQTAACTGGATHVDPAELERLLSGAKMTVPRCDQPARICLGLSMAGWNALVALGLPAASAFAFLRGRRPA